MSSHTRLAQALATYQCLPRRVTHTPRICFPRLAFALLIGCGGYVSEKFLLPLSLKRAPLRTLALSLAAFLFR